jgi:hypothetical protein
LNQRVSQWVGSKRIVSLASYFALKIPSEIPLGDVVVEARILG